jgi:predicted permease
MTTLPQDLRLALRRLAQAPGFACLAILTLALGLGANVAVFSLVHTLLLRPLPLPEAHRLVGVYESRDGAGSFPLSLPDYADYRGATTVFSGLAAHYPSAPLAFATGEGQEEINGSVVSANYFSLLGVEPERGRFFLAEEDSTPGGDPVAVVSHRLWQSRLGGREDVVGTVVNLNGTAFTVVGVAPSGFTGVLLRTPSEVWIPTAMASVGYRWCDAASRDCTWLALIGRLKPGRALGQARAEMAVLGRGVRAAHRPGDAGVRGLAVAPLAGVHPAERPGLRRLAGLLLAAVTLVVLVAGANLGGLLVARGLTREQEIATRLALGAPRRRVVSLYLAETLLIAVAGGAGGLLVAAWLGRLVALLDPAAAPLALGLDPAVAAYAALLAVATGLLVGAVPGLQASRRSLVPGLKGGRRPPLLGLLVVVQVALSFVLLTSMGLLARSLASLDQVGSLDSGSVATLRLRPRLVGYGPRQAQAFHREVVRRLAALSGVASVSLAAGLPPFPYVDPQPVSLPRRADGGGVQGPAAWTDEIGPRLFETLGIPLLRGRDFDERDAAGGAPVAIVNRTLAAALWPAGEAVGRSLVAAGRTFEVVGVVEDAAYRNATEPALAQVYTPYWQDPAAIDARLAVRSTGDAAALLPAMRRAIREIDPAVPVTESETMRDRLARRFAPVHLAGRVLAAAGGLALFLAAVGLYGVLALAVAQRRREIGIRAALGGSRAQLVRPIVGDALRLAGLAVALGLPAALAVTRTLAHFLYGVSLRDPLTFVAALAVLAAVSALASFWPAQRASRVDPLVALRQP